jgi:hypothetical protein
MATQSITYAVREPASHPCPCGCKECPGDCCTLQCLERPRFFCGQLLTDQDLTGLVTWTQNRLRLARYRHGWGVVCGLDVRCGDVPCTDPTDKRPGKGTASVVVGPGYAVSCCGDDVIVCEDTVVDLDLVCRDDKDPCAEFRDDLDDTMARVGCWEGPRREVRIVDLLLTSREVHADPQTAFGRSECKETNPCEYGRTREGAALLWRPVPSDEPLDSKALTEWQARYEACLEIVSSFGESLAGVGSEVAAKLNKFVRAHPPHDFCFVGECIRRLSEQPEVAEDEVARVLFWLMLDCRNAFLRCNCHGCAEDTAVPLARIWLWSKMEGSKRVCRVLRIESRPPYRRMIRSDCWPAPRGEVNVARAIWLGEDEARCVLAELGLRVNQVNYLALTDSSLSATTLLDAFGGSPFVVCGGEVDLHLIDPSDGSRARVVRVSGPRATDVVHPSVTFQPERVRVQPAEAPPSDDLTKIKEIGPSRADVLRRAGVKTYEDLVDIPIEKLRVLFPKMADELFDGWKKQAEEKIR